MSLTRNLPAALASEVAKQGWHPCILAYVDWPTGTVRAHSGVGDIVYDGNTYTGVGAFGRISAPSETRSGVARRLTVSLFAARDSIIGEAIAGSNARQREGEFFFGAVTERSGNVLVSDPVSFFRGTVDAVTFELSAVDPEGVLSVEAALQLSFVSGPSLRRFASQYHSAEDQARLFPADTAGRLIQAAEAAATNRTWPE